MLHITCAIRGARIITLPSPRSTVQGQKLRGSLEYKETKDIFRAVLRSFAAIILG